MAICEHIGKLSSIQKDFISTHLTISPKETYFDRKRNFYRKKINEDQGEDNKTVTFYSYDQQTGIIRLPYKYGENLLGYNPNLLLRYPITDLKFTRKLYESQIEMYTQSIADLVFKRTVNLNIFTGAGKTILAACLSCYLSLYTLILTTSTTLLPQWEKSFQRFTNAKIHIVDGIFICDPYTNVIICMTSRIQYIPQEWLSMIGTLIIDESHTFCSSSRVPAILATNPKYIITASATPFRDDDMHVMMEAVSGIHRIIKISKKPFNVTRYNTGVDIEIPVDYAGTPNWNELVNLMCEDIYRNTLIIELIKTYYTKHKILILTARKNHVLLLHKLISELGIKCDYMTGKKKAYSDSNVLIGTIKKIGTGFDEESACEDFDGIRISRLILAVSIKKKSLLEQVAGRVFRSDFPELDYLIDDNNISIKHFTKNIDWFISRNGTIKEYNTPRALHNKIATNGSTSGTSNKGSINGSTSGPMNGNSIIQKNTIVTKIDPSLFKS